MVTRIKTSSDVKFSIRKDKVPVVHIDVSHVGEYYVRLLV